jgi:putative Mg2+ transporter-C (MgtC) family protein
LIDVPAGSWTSEKVEIETADIWLQLKVVLWVAWAMALGAAIGYERAKASKAAGRRTHMLVAGAAALIVALSVEATAGTAMGDPSRGLHAVVTGIGFLGAGAIVQSKRGPVAGLTSAASVFYTAAIGCAIPFGFGIAATLATLMGLAVLAIMGRYFGDRAPLPHATDAEHIESD